MKAFIFPGQGIQKEGMGKELLLHFPEAKELLLKADALLGRSISQIMSSGSELDLSKSYNSQPAIYLYEVLLATVQKELVPDIVTGHSFGEFAALVVNKTLSFEDGLRLVSIRADIGDRFAAEMNSAMAAVIGLEDKIVEDTIQNISAMLKEPIFVANYNGPGQIVLSGSRIGIKAACKKFKEIGAKRAVILPIEGAFHTPLMKSAENSFSNSIDALDFQQPILPICQCSDSSIYMEADLIKDNLRTQMTSSVNWTKMVHNLVSYGVNEFIEIGTDDTLQKIVKRMYPELKVTSILNIDSYKGKLKDYSL
jgi:[acyl-carrier-protein] S-malonyltransferase